MPRWISQGPSKPHRASFSMEIPAGPTIWNSFATVGVRDFWENACMVRVPKMRHPKNFFFSRPVGFLQDEMVHSSLARQEIASSMHRACIGLHRPSKAAFDGRFSVHPSLHRSASTDAEQPLTRTQHHVRFFPTDCTLRLGRRFIVHCARALPRMIGPATVRFG